MQYSAVQCTALHAVQQSAQPQNSITLSCPVGSHSLVYIVHLHVYTLHSTGNTQQDIIYGKYSMRITLQEILDKKHCTGMIKKEIHNTKLFIGHTQQETL